MARSHAHKTEAGTHLATIADDEVVILDGNYLDVSMLHRRFRS